MYEQITAQTDTWMPDQHMYEFPDVPEDMQGDIWPYNINTNRQMHGHTNRCTNILTDVWMHEHANRHKDVHMTTHISAQQTKCMHL